MFSVFSDKKKMRLSVKSDEGGREVSSLKRIRKFYVAAVEKRNERTREILKDFSIVLRAQLMSKITNYFM